MPSILPGSGNAKNPSSREMVLGKNDAADDILDQIALSKAQKCSEKTPLHLHIYTLPFKMICQKVMAAGTRNVHFSTKKVITFFSRRDTEF